MISIAGPVHYRCQTLEKFIRMDLTNTNPFIVERTIKDCMKMIFYHYTKYSDGNRFYVEKLEQIVADWCYVYYTTGNDESVMGFLQNYIVDFINDHNMSSIFKDNNEFNYMMSDLSQYLSALRIVKR